MAEHLISRRCGNRPYGQVVLFEPGRILVEPTNNRLARRREQNRRWRRRKGIERAEIVLEVLGRLCNLDAGPREP